MPAWQNKYHDNGRGEPERKFVNPDGREAIYDGDSGDLVTDPNLRGTYNYTNAPRWDSRTMNPKKLGNFIYNGTKHLIQDVAPYKLFGNDR